MENVKRIFDIMLQYEARHPEQNQALSCKRDGEWIYYSPKQYTDLSNILSYALIAKNIQPGDKVAVISTNRPEWTIIQMAVTQIGAVLVPVYPTISSDDYLYILNHCEAKLLIMEGEEVMNKIQKVRAQLLCLQDIYTFIDRKEFPYWEQLLEFGRQNPHPEQLQRRRDAVGERDCAMIIYTSGTTGQPKGVMLSHYNLMQQLRNLEHIPAKWSKRALSFLPLCHAYENMLVLLYQYLGITIFYVSHLTAIQSSIKEVHPTMMSAVPRVFETFYNGILKVGKGQTGLAQRIFFWAVELAKQFRVEAEERTMWYNIRHCVAERLVYKKIRAGLGLNEFDVFVSGAASLQPQLYAFFSAIGMPVFEGYGMTETSPVIAVSNREKYGREPGTVGFPLGGVEVRITSEGEIICKGHNVMIGYYKDEAQTCDIIDAEGWLHTGDLGRFTARGQLVLTGRKKNLFKTSTGKYVNPQVVEDKMMQSPFVAQVVVVGENRKFAAALVVPNFDTLKYWCGRHNIVYTTNALMTHHPEVVARIKQEIDLYNRELGKAENVMRFSLVPDEWSLATGYMTPTLKIKRNKVIADYADEIDKMYAN